MTPSNFFPHLPPLSARGSTFPRALGVNESNTKPSVRTRSEKPRHSWPKQASLSHVSRTILRSQQAGHSEIRVWVSNRLSNPSAHGIFALIHKTPGNSGGRKKERTGLTKKSTGGWKRPKAHSGGASGELLCWMTAVHFSPAVCNGGD